jgi:hypothetical protein
MEVIKMNDTMKRLIQSAIEYLDVAIDEIPESINLSDSNDYRVLSGVISDLELLLDND